MKNNKQNAEKQINFKINFEGKILHVWYTNNDKLQIMSGYNTTSSLHFSGFLISIYCKPGFIHLKGDLDTKEQKKIINFVIKTLVQEHDCRILDFSEVIENNFITTTPNKRLCIDGGVHDAKRQKQ